MLFKQCGIKVCGGLAKADIGGEKDIVKQFIDAQRTYFRFREQTLGVGEQVDFFAAPVKLLQQLGRSVEQSDISQREVNL